ncbi:MAG: leucine-rich repeat protein, partial [Clostridia bacterium]|nr:leucine-rich repeat protein [Clostridia bacterium]
DVSFQATGVEAHIKNASLTGVTTLDQDLAASGAEGEVINTSMTQTDINTTFATWQNLTLDFNESADDIVFKFDIANTSDKAGNYIEIDYSYTFTTENPNVDVFPGDENGEGDWENNNYILAPKGATPAAADYETFTLKFRVLDKELNVPNGTKVNLIIELKHIVPAELDTNNVYQTIKYTLNNANNTATLSTLQGNPTKIEIPAVVKSGANNYIVTEIAGSAFGATPACNELKMPNSIKTIGDSAFGDEWSEIKTIILPKSITDISMIFFGAVTSIYFPNTLTNLDGVFYMCPSLETIELPNGLESFSFFDSGAGNAVVTGITLPISLKSLSLFGLAVDSIFIPKNVTTITRCQIAGDADIMVDSRNTVYDSRNNCNAIIETATNKLIAGNSKTFIPNTVTSIGAESFFGSVSSLVIPSSVLVVEEGFVCFPSSSIIELKIDTRVIDGNFIPVRDEDFVAELIYINKNSVFTPPTYPDFSLFYTAEKIGNEIGDADGDGYILYTKNA